MEHIDQVGSVVLVQRVPVGEDHPRIGQERNHSIQEDVALAIDEFGHPFGDGFKLRQRAHAVRRPGAQAGGHLVLQTSHPHLEELVEPVGEDGQELHPFEQRKAVVLGQLQ